MHLHFGCEEPWSKLSGKFREEEVYGAEKESSHCGTTSRRY